MISQTWEFFVPVYLYLFACNFSAKLPFVPSLLAIKVWCQFHPHSFYQPFNGNCTTYTKGITSYMYHFIFSLKACFTKLLNAFFASIFRCRCYNHLRILVVMRNGDDQMFQVFTFTLTQFLAKTRGRCTKKRWKFQRVKKNGNSMEEVGLTSNYRKDSCISRTPNFQAWFWKKITPKSTRLVKKVCPLFGDVGNKLDEICISSDINKLKLLFNQCPYSL